MEKGEAVFQEILKLVEIVKADGEKFYAGNKQAGKRARKALDAIAKLKVQWRKETV